MKLSNYEESVLAWLDDLNDDDYEEGRRVQVAQVYALLAIAEQLNRIVGRLMSVRSELRALVFEWADNQCEHPKLVNDYPDNSDQMGYWVDTYKRCPHRAAELAHIWPRGMGHTGYRDTIDNVMAACTLHARSTDDLSSPEWGHVPAPHDRKALKEWVAASRVDWGIENTHGVDIETDN